MLSLTYYVLHRHKAKAEATQLDKLKGKKEKGSKGKHIEADEDEVSDVIMARLVTSS